MSVVSSEDAVGGVTTGDGLAMDTVGGDEAVITGHTGFHTSSDTFLSVVQMAESTDLFLLVEEIRDNFNTSHGNHLLEVGSELLLVGLSVGGNVQALHSVGARTSGSLIVVLEKA